jgi:hypothetical protein
MGLFDKHDQQTSSGQLGGYNRYDHHRAQQLASQQSYIAESQAKMQPQHEWRTDYLGCTPTVPPEKNNLLLLLEE